MARMEHFAVFAHDLEKTSRFYQDALGLKVALDNTSAPVRGYFLADDQGTMLEVIERPRDVAAVETRYACHVAFFVADLSAERARLEARGVVFESDSAVDSDEFKTAFFRDPDGNRCQIVWRKRALV